jgi:hypothetical protein
MKLATQIGLDVDVRMRLTTTTWEALGSFGGRVPIGGWDGQLCIELDLGALFRRASWRGRIRQFRRLISRRVGGGFSDFSDSAPLAWLLRFSCICIVVVRRTL